MLKSVAAVTDEREDLAKLDKSGDMDVQRQSRCARNSLLMKQRVRCVSPSMKEI